MSAEGTALLAKTKTQDGLQHHELTQKKLLSPKAQCISKILENCISKVEIAVTLPAVLQLNSASSVVDKELSRALQEHETLDKRLEMLEGLHQDSDGEQEGEARAQLEKDIKNSVRDLLRLVRAHPEVILGLKAELGMEVEQNESIIIRQLKKFQSHMLEKLSSSLDEELKLALHKPVSASSAHNIEHEISLKEDEVVTALKEVDAKIYQKNLKIQNLQCSLQEKKAHEAGLSFHSERQCESHVKTSRLRQASMQQEIDRLNIQLKKLILENKKVERVLQEKNEMVETEIKYLLQHFDSKMEEIQANLELNEMDNKSQEEELRKLEKPFSIQEKEFNEILERRQVAEEKRKVEMRELELKTKAAILAQAWWRGYCTRKALKNKGKSKKAKKGKGKKSKQ